MFILKDVDHQKHPLLQTSTQEAGLALSRIKETNVQIAKQDHVE